MCSRLNQIILNGIKPTLEPYLNQFHSVAPIIPYNNKVEIRGKVKKEDLTKTLLLRFFINHKDKEVLISNILMPNFMQKKNIGKQLIRQIYELGRSEDYRLLVVDPGPTFYRCLLKRGAKAVEENHIIQITDNTNLRSRFA